MILNSKQLLSLVLFMVLTTTVVNAHALSHLFDGDNSAIEQCKTCDEYVLTSYEDINFIAPSLPELTFSTFETKVSTLVSFHIESLSIIRKSGKYYNKPPPFKLA